MRVPPALFLAALSLGAVATASAQAAPAGALPVVPSAGAAAVVAGGFGEAWRARPGAGGRIEAPAYGGALRLALTATRFEDRVDTVPEFTFVAATLGWGPAVRLPGGVQASGGPLVGGAHLRFAPGDTFTGNLQNETEAVVGGFASVRVPLAGRLHAWADAEVVRVALADPRTLVLVGGGVALRLDAPAWLRAAVE